MATLFLLVACGAALATVLITEAIWAKRLEAEQEAARTEREAFERERREWQRERAALLRRPEMAPVPPGQRPDAEQLTTELDEVDLVGTVNVDGDGSEEE